MTQKNTTRNPDAAWLRLRLDIIAVVAFFQRSSPLVLSAPYNKIFEQGRRGRGTRFLLGYSRTCTLPMRPLCFALLSVAAATKPLINDQDVVGAAYSRSLPRVTCHFLFAIVVLSYLLLFEKATTIVPGLLFLLAHSVIAWLNILFELVRLSPLASLLCTNLST